MGWLGLTEQETLNTSIPALLEAINARREIIAALGGQPPNILPEPAEPEAPAASDILAAFRVAGSGDPARRR